MSVEQYLSNLWETGRVQVPPPTFKETNVDRDSLEHLFKMHDRVIRLTFPGTAPPLNLEFAQWSAIFVYRVSQLLVHRGANIKESMTWLEQECPGPIDSSATYSVDLTMRYLPDLIRLANAVNSSDPLIDKLKSIAECWPLSSIGINAIHCAASESIIHHRGLLQLYVDRVIVSSDLSRLHDPIVRHHVRLAIGIHEELAPKLMAAIHGLEEKQINEERSGRSHETGSATAS